MVQIVTKVEMFRKGWVGWRWVKKNEQLILKVAHFYCYLHLCGVIVNNYFLVFFAGGSSWFSINIPIIAEMMVPMNIPSL